MEHKPKFVAVELSPGAFIQVHSTLPSILNRDQFKNTMSVVTDGPLSVGDLICEVFSDRKFQIEEVVATRKAKGDWSGKSHEGTKPTWSKVKYRL